MVRTWIGGLGVLVVGATFGWLLGPGFTRVDRIGDLAGDAALPLSGEMSERERGEAVRGELDRLVALNERFRQEEGRYPFWDELGPETPGYDIEYSEAGGGWLARMWTEDDGMRRGVTCAVAVGRVPTYVAGITLRRSGEVRCSRDLATRFNRVLWTWLPVGEWR